ncbi:MAG: heavy metal translocating P-type ATPase [Pseudomonadota bacterium]
MNTVKDPVCGMNVDPERARGGSFEHDGTQYFFCSPKCRERFAADPAHYLRRPEVAAPVAPAPVAEIPAKPAKSAQIWLCPMDPEVRQDHPGPCPKCGMALEPEQPTVGQANPELADMSRRLWIAASLSTPLFLIAMGSMLPFHGAMSILSGRARGLLELGLATPVCLWAGLPFLQRGVRSLKNRSLNMFTLIALGVSVAYSYSVVALFAPGLFPDSLRTDHGELGLYFEAAAVIVTLVLVGQVLELRARSRTGAAIRQLLELAPQTARRVAADGSESEIPIAAVRVTDRLRVFPGEKLPIDGLVLEGASHVDESMITGEPGYVSRRAGERVIGGTLNGTGSLLIQAEKVAADTLLSRIVGLVAEAQRSRAPIQKLVDRISSYFVPVVIAISFATFAVWLLVGPEPRLAHAVVSAVAVLIVACPCALGLATPMSIMVSTGLGASAGVLFKDAEALELLSQVDTLVVDKTGTLTEGKPRLTRLVASPGVEEESLLRWAASVEAQSEHPLARAVLDAAAERGIRLAPLSDFESLTGRGIRGSVEGEPVALGNRALLEAQSAELGSLAALAAELEAQGQTVVFLTRAGKTSGMLAISDPIKASTPGALRALREDGMRIVMLTGDAHASAQAVARELGISEVIAGVLPEQKAIEISRLERQGRIVAMAGDGINDAPALARATVGIAMGTGTDIAIESAGITLIKGDLACIARARRISRLALRNIRQNLYFAFGYNALGIPLAAGLLYPTFGLLLSPTLAAAAMSLSSVSVISNALRLKRAMA